MAIIKLESLVLRGVSVLSDGRAVELCRGASEKAEQTPEVRFSMRHPSLGYPLANQNQRADAQDDDVKRDVVSDVFGAGRSRGRAGVLPRRSPAVVAGRTVPCGWSTPERHPADMCTPTAIRGWRDTWSVGCSPEKSAAAKTRIPLTGTTSFTAPTVAASTRGTGVI